MKKRELSKGDLMFEINISCRREYALKPIYKDIGTLIDTVNTQYLEFVLNTFYFTRDITFHDMDVELISCDPDHANVKISFNDLNYWEEDDEHDISVNDYRISKAVIFIATLLCKESYDVVDMDILCKDYDKRSSDSEHDDDFERFVQYVGERLAVTNKIRKLNVSVDRA